jgi:hypothetical protein
MHEVPPKGLNHSLRLLRNVEAYWLAIETAVLSVLIQPGCLGMKDTRLRSARCTQPNLRPLHEPADH